MASIPRLFGGQRPLHVTVVGIGADGWMALFPAARSLISEADVVVGGSRHLALLPERDDQVRTPWPSPLRANLTTFFKPYAGQKVVALASGDPLVSGVGTTLIDVLGRDAVTIEPAVSSVALARARMGWSDESCAVLTLVGRSTARVLRELAPGRRILVLSSDEHTPATIARLLTDAGYGASAVTVLSDLGADDEARTHSRADLFDAEVSRLNIVAIEAAGWSLATSWAAGLPDEAFENDGQLTKRDLRASALARLAPAPGEHLWDVGAGAGSVGIEWMRLHPSCRATAIEADPERAARISRNAHALGVPDLDVVTGSAPEALRDLRHPDAIFIGGGATRAGVLSACLAALRPGGRLLVHGVTVETESLLATAHRDHGGELTRISVESSAPVGTFTGWTPARTVTQWAWTAPH